MQLAPTVQILELSANEIKFALTNCDVSLANALRRILIAQVPTLAPHLISILENTSCLHDEFLCHRVGLLPFISDQADNFKYPWQCTCSQVDDCTTCKAHFILQARNLDRDSIDVTTLDIKPVMEKYASDGPIDSRPVEPVEFQSDLQKGKKIGVPIVRLGRDQQINLRFDVQKGIGRMHSKWSPVSLATFQPDPEIKLDDKIELTLEEKIAIRDSCPTKVFQVHDGNFIVANPQKCIFCLECKKKAEQLNMSAFKNLLRVGKKKDRWIFTVESIGTLPAAAIVQKSFAVLRQKLKDIDDRIH